MQRSSSVAVRLDKWLWAARFYKTRALAVEAINGGHVHINGLRVKPSRNVNVADEMRISKGVTTFNLVVKDLASKRGPASQAQALYEENAQSIHLREQQAIERKAAGSTGPKKRPDKRARRKIIRFINKNQ